MLAEPAEAHLLGRIKATLVVPPVSWGLYLYLYAHFRY